MTARRHSPHPGQEPASERVPAPVAAKAASIDAARPLSRKSVVRSALVIAVAGLAIYLVLPKLIAVFGAWPRLSTLNPVWFAVALAAELLSFTCNFALQKLALRTSAWFPVVTAGLAGNAVTNSLPGGEAAGAAVQFGMLTTAGFDTGTAVGGLAAFSLIGIGGLLALPVFALPAILAGVPVSPGLAHTALLGIAGFAAFAVFGEIVLRADWPLAAAGRAAQRLRNWATRGRRPPVTGLDRRLLDQRDTIRGVLDRKWWQAALLTAGRLGFDYGCLLAALCATSRRWSCWLTRPRASWPSCRSRQAAWASWRQASAACWCWPACAPATPCWPSSPTGSPRTGFPSSPGRRPTCSSGTATAGRSSGAPRQACRASRRLASRFPHRRTITRAGA
jgi:hypothetical protein